MNNVIRDLQVQAFADCRGSKDSQFRTDDVFERFAHLIIQECVKSVNDTPFMYRDYRNQIEESMRNACAWSIKDKFGVNDEE